MNPTEMLEELDKLANAPFDAAEFPFAFLECFGNKETTLARLRKTGAGGANKSDFSAAPHIINAVLQRNNIHLATCEQGKAEETLKLLLASPATAKWKARFALATDGVDVRAEYLKGDEPPLACDFADLSSNESFGFFMPLAGLSYSKELKESSFDIKATGRLNRLYLELLKANPDWEKRPHELNHFMARLIFCFFAEDTDIFHGKNLFTATIEQMTAGNADDTQAVITNIFRAMNIDSRPNNPAGAREKSALPRYAQAFPYVNGGLFAPAAAAGETALESPHFSKIARAHLLKIGELDWSKVNPDIFGSMIQAIADENERAHLGMHYTSVPNILKVLNPLFLDGLRAKLEQAGENKGELTKLRNRLKKIRVFDPACGSGNFLVIAYRELRQIEAEINRRYGEPGRKTELKTENFRGIELKSFPAEIARLALVIAEYQCNVHYYGQKTAAEAFLPLKKQNWITCGNALRLDWQSICPAIGKQVQYSKTDLLDTNAQAEVNFNDEGGEVYICGNPPYLGSTWQSPEQKADMKAVFAAETKTYKFLDYVACWFMKAAAYAAAEEQRGAIVRSAFVATNSICQGQQVAALWPLIFKAKRCINFAWENFKWSNLAAHKAGVTVNIIGLANSEITPQRKFIYKNQIDSNETLAREAQNINAYLLDAPDIIVEKRTDPLSDISPMTYGNKPTDGGNLLLSPAELEALHLTDAQKEKFIRRIYGSDEFINNKLRYCIWVKPEDEVIKEAKAISAFAERFKKVAAMRAKSVAASTHELAYTPWQFESARQTGDEALIAIPSVSSENRDYLPVGLLPPRTIINNRNFGLYDAPLWNLALIASRLHWVWADAVCGKLETRFNYSSTIGWNTFPVPDLTEQNRADLTACAENILLAREAHFPATIADLYAKDKDGKLLMPRDLQEAHEANDALLEEIYIGRRFKNDTERLEHLFKLYTEMVAAEQTKKVKPNG